VALNIRAAIMVVKRRILMERVLEIIREQLNLTGVELTEESSLKDDLGVDSIDMVELVMAFEDEYGIEVQYEELEKKVKTVGDIVDFLREQGADV
jgi:acyl carrier protein